MPSSPEEILKAKTLLGLSDRTSLSEIKPKQESTKTQNTDTEAKWEKQKEQN